MRKIALVLVAGLAGLAIIWALVMTLPIAALFLRVTLESLMPSTIGWDAKNAWAKCDGAIAGSVDWPSAPAAACTAMHLCANEATLTPDQQAALLGAIRRLPSCGNP
ncbi:MAG: hypothetical protein U1E60_05230 [Reyranellaceae bacterium]